MARNFQFHSLTFVGEDVEPAELHFTSGLNLVWGASNTGKSFTLQSLDFMLGSRGGLEEIPELDGYESVLLSLTLGTSNDYTLRRSVRGGSLELHKGASDVLDSTTKIRDLAPSRQGKNNLSDFLLGALGLADRQLAKNAHGEKRALSFRDLAHILLVDEMSIQAKRSPIEGGQRDDEPVERSVLRMLLSGSDDSSIVPVLSAPKAKTSRMEKLELIDEMLADLEVKLEDSPEESELEAQRTKLNEQLARIQAEYDGTRASLQGLLDEKRDLVQRVEAAAARVDEIRVHLERFRQLDEVYASDVERLEALEESGFLLETFGQRACPLCGAEPDAQTIESTPSEITTVREASLAEIRKVVLLRHDLETTTSSLETELSDHDQSLASCKARLSEVEAQLSAQYPSAKRYEGGLAEILSARDGVKSFLSLYDRQRELLTLRQEVEAIKAASKEDRPSLVLSGSVAQEFADVVLSVLSRWEFPARSVSFDHKTWDLRIDGKLRTANGKGVRAVTHAAFKIALLIYCRDHELPLPDFLVLDTPLLTYRDPRDPAVLSKHGVLEEDEKALAQSPVRQRFFEHLHSLRDDFQIVVLENVDLPDNIDDLADRTVFTGMMDDRWGLLPPKL